jgi:tagatose 6-phosphate kinase
MARLLQQTGYEVVITGFAGGLVGDEIASHLDDWTMPHHLVRCGVDSRRTVSAFSVRDEAATAYYETGAAVAAPEWEQLTAGFSQLVHGAAAVVLSGSLPAGLPVEAYSVLAALASAAGAAVFVDTQPAPLQAALKAKPALVKPNEHELAEAFELPVPVVLPAAAGAARELLDEGAQGAVVSLGARGLLAVLPGMTLRATPPEQRGNPVGAGDAALAALIDGHLSGQPWPDRLRRAAATSAAAVRQPLAGIVDATDVAALESLVSVSEL